MQVTYPTRGISAELGRYLRTEYGANEAFGRTMIRRMADGRSKTVRSDAVGAVRRLLAAAWDALGAVGAHPEGA